MWSYLIGFSNLSLVGVGWDHLHSEWHCIRSYYGPNECAGVCMCFQSLSHTPPSLSLSLLPSPSFASFSLAFSLRLSVSLSYPLPHSPSFPLSFSPPPFNLSPALCISESLCSAWKTSETGWSYRRRILQRVLFFLITICLFALSHTNHGKVSWI